MRGLRKLVNTARALVAHSGSRSTAAFNGIVSHAQVPRVRAFSSAPTYPSQTETSILAGDDDRHDHNASHLVCSKCSSPISNTKDLIFFKWRSGIHMSCLTEAPLQCLRAEKHKDTTVSWKSCKLFCIKCNHSIGSIARVYNSDKILFKASDVAIQMPVHQSPMLSLSGYPSSMLGFSMWSELLLMLESQPHLKKQLDIRRVDNIRTVSVEKKEINTMLLLASDLKSLLDLVETHMADMNCINLVTALRRASILKTAQIKPKPAKFQFSVSSEAPEDLLMDFPSHILADPKVARAREQDVTKRLWKLVDATESVLNFGIDALQDLPTLSKLAASLRRLNIGRPSILKPIALQTINLAQDHKDTKFNGNISFIASTVAHLASKEIRSEPWVKELLFTVADMALAADRVVFQDSVMLYGNLVPIAKAMVMTGHFHEEFQRRVFAALALDPNPRSQIRVYLTLLDNALMQRGDDFIFQDKKRLEDYKHAFTQYEKRGKNGLFRIRHQAASTLEAMHLDPVTLYAFPELGYTVDLALLRERIAIELNEESAYLAHDPRSVEDEHDAIAIESGFRQRPYTTNPTVDLKARHLEHAGWIVVQLPVEEFESIVDSVKRTEYMSMLIEIATYARAQQLEDES